MENYVIRKAEVKDWPTLLYVFDKSLRSIEKYETHSEEDYVKLYQTLMNHSFVLYDTYLYTVDDEILGFICYYQHKIDCYKYRLLYAGLMVTTQQKFIVDTQKRKGKESKYHSKESHQITKKKEREGEKRQKGKERKGYKSEEGER